VCGCDLGFDYNQPTDVYYVGVINPYGPLVYKIGITQRTLRERFEKDMPKILELKIFKFKNGYDALDFEQQILIDHQKFRYSGPDLLQRGNTELFACDVLGLDRKAA
jgi:hypothetical protein